LPSAAIIGKKGCEINSQPFRNQRGIDDGEAAPVSAEIETDEDTTMLSPPFVSHLQIG
jgi:hypothetical protein